MGLNDNEPHPPVSATVSLLAGGLPLQNVSATVVPSDCRQVTLRVWERLTVQLLPAAGVHAPVCQL